MDKSTRLVGVFVLCFVLVGVMSFGWNILDDNSPNGCERISPFMEDAYKVSDQEVNIFYYYENAGCRFGQSLKFGDDN